MHTRRRLSDLYNLNPDSKNPQIDSKFPMEASSINKTNIPNEWICNKLFYNMILLVFKP